MLRLPSVVAVTVLAMMPGIEAAQGQLVPGSGGPAGQEGVKNAGTRRPTGGAKGPGDLSALGRQPPIQNELNLSDEQREQIRDLQFELMEMVRGRMETTLTPKEMKYEESRLAQILKPEQLKH